MAAKKKPTPPGDEYYAAMCKAKVAAGLSLDQATEVTARQRAEDEANGVSIGETNEESQEA
jgi:hypothetical protein